ncbi:MAG: precorrin-6y C5,15-methyltransferase (decarboxylating) subunit CbiE [Atopobiaceae bacterium]
MKIYLIGIGMGNPDTCTLKALSALEASDVVIGAQRMLDAVEELVSTGHITHELTYQKAVLTDEIISKLKEAESSGKGVVSVVFSGDTGFFSGAGLIQKRLEDCDIETICGISSISYMAARIGKSWQGTKIISVHGRSADALGAIQTHTKTFILTGGALKVQDVCRQLCRWGLEDVEVYVGERLSYPDERIAHGTADDFYKMNFLDLSVMFVINPHAIKRPFEAPSLSDNQFIRDKVPMTKEEIRELICCKLKIQANHVVWDVGAGTGSVSVEAALAAREGHVFAVEKSLPALNLIYQNVEQFGLTNVEVVDGTAPSVLSVLPAPDRVFIGGSSGELAAIVAAAVAKNPQVRIVVSAVSLETITAVLPAFRASNLTHIECVQLSVARAREAGQYHLMRAENPVYLFSAEGAPQEEVH